MKGLPGCPGAVRRIPTARSTFPHTVLHLIALLTVVLLPACASTGGGGTRRDRNLLTAEELAPMNNRPLYEAIQRLRPNWLRARANTSISVMGDVYPAVRVDNAWQTVDDLRSLQTSDVEEARYIEARDATTLFGTGYVNGIVDITTVRSRSGG